MADDKEGGRRGDPDDRAGPHYHYRYAETAVPSSPKIAGMRANELTPAVLDPWRRGIDTPDTNEVNEP